ncbi:hypothetical protein [Photobacterium phosphoreum]|uniref:hypothetical protein n=1 Tax=Photobacterium phosphoreum TaxID=659 RepID=UPI001E2B4B49|nr:hypothetical protein [Photobacterium phosphoreum]MCD9511915.1 hypothetical protein [Photobacterium phosphoreum]
MAQAQKIEQSVAPSAQESLANIHALFGSQSSAGLIYDNLPANIRTTICFTARLTKEHASMKLADMDDFAIAKVQRAINDLDDALKPLAHRPLKDFK